MVCLGNISRSPLAEGILKHKLPKDLFHIDSAGEARYHIGRPPDLRSMHVASEKEIDITHQKARKFSKDDFLKFNKIYVMDRSNIADIKQMGITPENRSKVSLLIENNEVPDPYYGNENSFKNVFKLINQACNLLIHQLLKKSHDPHIVSYS